jgi:eukaryotic-like serine/threonine-protein kinase
VIASDPAQGRSVKRSSPVALTISKGPEPVDLPNLTGQAEEDAVRTLTSLKLRPAVTQDFSDTVTIGMVISQTPGPGRRLPGDSVALVVSKGPQLVDLPSVVGQQYDQAKQTLEARGLKVERRKILGGFFGTVRSQLPGPGPVPAGSTVTLIVV